MHILREKVVSICVCLEWTSELYPNWIFDKDYGSLINPKEEGGSHFIELGTMLREMCLT